MTNKISRLQTGSNYPAVNDSDILTQYLPLPPLPEQEKIAEVLGCWDLGIERLEKLIDAKRKMKKALMQQLLTGKKRFKEFKGQEWKEVRLGETCEIAKKAKLESVEGLFLLTVKLHCLGIRKNERVTPKITKRGRPYHQHNSGDFLIGRQNFHNGGFGIVPPELDGGITSNAISSILVDESKLTKSFLYHQFSNPNYYKRIEHIIGGTGQKEISDKQFLRLKILLPPIEEQQKIASVLNAAGREIELLCDKLEALKNQKKGLMQKLLTGKIRVKV